tara:strand:+ start:1212 stop:1481 length:270 start_codon:yes stop_codon:yes gene_type:complete
MYVLIQKQYDPSYRAVQAGHALTEYLLKNGEWQNETLIYILSDDILFDYQILKEMGLELYPFYEPDVDNQMTAFSCYSDHKVFHRYEMN